MRCKLPLLQPIIFLFVTCALIITCAPPPKPDIDTNNAEFSIDVPPNAPSQDTVGQAVTFQLAQTMFGWLDSVVVVVTSTDNGHVDTTIVLRSPFDATTSFDVVFRIPGAKTLDATAYFSSGVTKPGQTIFYAVALPDTTPPEVVIAAPADSDTVHVAAMPMIITGTASDESRVSSVEYVTIHGTQRDSGDAEGTTSWRVDSLDLDTGATKIIIRAVDSADNRGADTIVVIYRDTSSTVTTAGDTAAPVVTITAPADSDTVHISAVPVTVSGTANDDSGIARVEYSLLVGTSNNSPAVQGKTTWSIAGLQLRAGTAVIEVRATDSAGNVGADTIAIVYDTTTAPQPPVITSQPADMQIVINQAATLTVVATGTNPLTYAWKRGTTALTGSDSTYHIAMAQFTDSGTYACIVTDANGLSDTTTPWRLQVLASSTPPSITTPPASATVSEGDSVSLAVFASGTSLTYQWYKDGDSIPGATARVFHTDTAEFSDSGSYTVKVCNAQKCTTSAAAHLTVQTGAFGITVSAGAHGSITPAGSSGVVAVARGANQVFTITPATGYHIDTVHVDDTVNVAAKNAGSFTFSNVTANHMISAVFAINTYTLSVTSLHGSVTTNPSTSSPVNHGTQVTLHATPSAGYYFSGWSGGVSSSDTPLVITMVSDTDITANFAAIGRFTINETSTHGSVTFSPDSADYLKGTKVKLTATPDAGYDFVQWTGDASGTKDTVTITVDTTKNVTAVFAIKTYPLTVTAGTGGSIAAPAMSPDTVDHGAATTLTATPEPGYNFQKWTVASGSAAIADTTSATTTVTLISGAATVRANFAAKPTVGFSASSSVGSEAMSPCSLSVQLSSASSELTTVTYSIEAGGTATNGAVTTGDYTLTTTTLDIPAGQTRGYIIFTVRNDTINEDDEGFTVTLGSVTSNVQLGPSAISHVYTIGDDDALTASFKRNVVSVIEGSVALDTVVLNRPSQLSVDVSFQSTGGTAVATRDYELGGSPISFAAMETQKAVTVTTVHNNRNTDTSTVVLTLQSASRGALGSRVRDTVRIVDVDFIPAGVICVDQNASGNNSGGSWKNACTTLTSALGKVTGSTQIWVAKGTYVPHPTDPYEYFSLAGNGIDLLGGFAGGEVDSSMVPDGALFGRNPRQNVTVLSGIEAQAVVMVVDNISGCIDGFTICNGDMGISVAGTQFQIRNCVVRDLFGGVGTDGKISGCVFAGITTRAVEPTNSASVPSGRTIENCIFYGNGSGLQALSSTNVLNCTFIDNEEGDLGLGSPGSHRVLNCIFRRTSPPTTLGSAIRVSAGYQMTVSVSVEYCILGGVDTNYIYGNTGSTISVNFTNQVTDPLFRFPALSTQPQGPDGIWATDDDGLIPLANSPAVDVGRSGYDQTIAYPGKDIRGAPRPAYSSGYYDIGAFEQ